MRRVIVELIIGIFALSGVYAIGFVFYHIIKAAASNV